MGRLKRKKIVLTACLIGSTMMLTGCREVLNMPVGTAQTIYSETSAANGQERYEMTNHDYNTSEEGAMEIDLAHPEENGGFGSWDGHRLIIGEEGTYLLSGKLDRGRLVISVCEDEVVHLILDGVEIKSADGAAIYVENAAKVIITVKEGTENVVSDGPEYDDEIRACVFSNADLTINGGGFLSVYGYYADAVRTKDQLKLVNTRLYVKAKKDGIRGNDGVIIHDSEVEAECEGIGILSNGDRSLVIIEGGSCKVIAGEYAVSANRYVSVSGCRTDLYAVLETVRCDGIVEFEEMPEQ